LSQTGKIAQDCWQEIPNHFPFVELGEFIIMPNHIHGIVIIDKPVEAQNFAPLQHEKQNKFGPQSQNLASIIHGYKSAVKKYATMNAIDFSWQPRFYDHIIRDDESFRNISAYIANNPLNWYKDYNKS
jgi:REP element-mobilizing transposase RayT